MNRRRTVPSILLAALLISSLVMSCLAPVDGQPTPGPTVTPLGVEGRVDSYLAVAPRILRSGQSETVSVSLFAGRNASNATVQVALLKDGQQLARTNGYIQGRGDLVLDVPPLAEGDYQIRLSGRTFQSESPVRVEEGTLLFLETDKPIYKPGQVVHIRVLTLDPELKPLPGDITVEVMDAKGLKIFKRDIASDEYGMATLDLPLSSEPNLGVWKVTAQSGKRTAQLDVRVERYVLPKYEVTVDFSKDWVLASERIKGTIAAEYSYGKPVKGEVEIKALRYVGAWEEFASLTRDIDGEIDFDLPAVQYVSGVPGAKGMGNVTLEVVVRERATGYEEKTTRLLTVAASPVTLQVIPESVGFKPSLPLSLLVVAETPDRKPVDADVQVSLAYTKRDFKVTQESHRVSVRQGKAILTITPPADAISLSLSADANDAYTSLAMQAGYSPTGSFIHVEQLSQGTLKVGDTAKFRVSATKEAANFYYEVVARGKIIFSDFSRSPDLAFTVTPLMAPNARLLVYQILPNSEVAADYMPFAVAGDYPQQVQVAFGSEEVQPNEQVVVSLQTEGPAKVGLVAVDRSVFILAENRLNLQQVFAELERLYQKPQVELHEARPFHGNVTARGARDVFQDAGVVVLSNKTVPDGKEYENPQKAVAGGLLREVFGLAQRAFSEDAAVPATAPMPTASPAPAALPQSDGLAEVQRVRQFFPETWIWTDLVTGADGKAGATFTAPDSITTWMLRAVALSKQAGLGIAEAQLRVLQPFFVQIDLPYSAIRGEQFPVKVALYNYLDTAEEFVVEIDRSDWFDLTGAATTTVRVGPNDVGGASFTIHPTKLGTKQVKITARSRSAADAIIKDLIIEPEGVAREEVENLVLAAGAAREVAMSLPELIVEGSARGYIALTGNYLTQSIQGLEGLLQMPFGCGEQNMILLAPNVFVARYLKETGQMKPEVMAKAENLMITGYQRQLTYRRGDGSFSAFGSQDKEGSLWLTAFVLKTFAQAKETMYIDDAVLDGAKAWITKHQKADGSFEAVGFVTHQEMLGGLQGKTALTAYVAIALKEAGDEAAAVKAARYLEGALDATDDPYAVAITAYALELMKSPRAAAAYDKLLSLAQESDEGLYWGGDDVEPLPTPEQPGIRPMPMPQSNRSATIETTAYATLALIEHGDRLNASLAAKWLVSRRNAFGGFGSTQDTVVSLQALTRFAAGAKSDVDATVTLRSVDWQKEVRISPANADVLQVIDAPIGGDVSVAVKGNGQVVMQTVRRYNVPDPDRPLQPVFELDVTYEVGQIEVNDLITVDASIRFTPPIPVEAGMVVLDVAIPTGFAPVIESLDTLVEGYAKLKRYEVAGRKVIFYIEDMLPGEQLQISFQAQALYPVKAQAVTSQAYSYYRPDWRGESLGGAMVVQ